MAVNQNAPGNISVGAISSKTLAERFETFTNDDPSGFLSGLADVIVDFETRLSAAEISVVSASSGIMSFWLDNHNGVVLVRAPFAMKIKQVQLAVQTTGTAGATTMDFEVNDASILTSPLSVANTDPDQTIDFEDRNFTVSIGDKLEIPNLTFATGALGVTGTIVFETT